MSARGKVPVQLALGLALVAVSWPANWLLEGMRTHLLFFPLWLGYVLFVDGLVARRTGDSILTRSPRGFAGLFFASIPIWWLFELLNVRLQNWEYVGSEEFGTVEYALLCSISFSTVLPAVLETAEWFRSFGWVERLARGPVVVPSRRLLRGSILAGVASLLAMLLWPGVFYPFAWISLVLLLEPLCRALGRHSLLSDLERGDWRPWVSLWCGVLVCGFFWEMWNAWSFPKWVYHVPGVDFLRVFEMPILGYLGYLPFSLELYLAKVLLLPGAPEVRLSVGPAGPRATIPGREPGRAWPATGPRKAAERP